jgi:hypothetical protein
MLGADFSAVLLPRLLTPRRGNLRVEWMLSHFYECFSVILYDDTHTSGAMAGSPASAKKVGEILCFYCNILSLTPE